MEQSVPMPSTLVLRSPLPVDECRRRLKDHTIGSLPGLWITVVGGGPELNGKIGERRLRLIRPHAMNDAVPKLVGTLEADQDGGTILAAKVRRTFGWPRPDARDDDDIDYLVEVLGRIGQFTKVDAP
jgi:hypothetical protein